MKSVREIKDLGKRGDVSALMLAYKEARRAFGCSRSTSASIRISRIVDAARRELERRGYHEWIKEQ